MAGRLLPVLLPALLLGVLATLGRWTGVDLLLFPEMAALSYELFAHPQGAWARSASLVVVSPVLAGIWGWELEQALGFGPLSVLLAVLGTLWILHLLSSPVTPSLSAAILPLVLGVHTLLYIPAILTGTALLLLMFGIWRRVAHAPAAAAVALPPRRGMLAHGLLLAALGGFGVVATILRFPLLIYPPLGVLGYETLTARHCGWRHVPLRMVSGMFLAGSIGLLLRMALGQGPLGVVLAFLVGVWILRRLDLSIPPALAAAVLPFLVPHVPWVYPLVVALGAAVMAGLLRVLHHLESGQKGSPLPRTTIHG